MLIKATKKLLDELKVIPCEISEVPSFFSWHANITTVNRRKAVMLINDATRMPVLLYGLKAAEFKRLDTLIIDAIKETILAFGIDEVLVGKYITESGAITYTKTDNKGVIGNMNQLVRDLSFYADKLTLNTYNQIQFNLQYMDYPFTIGKDYKTAKDLLPNYFAKLESGETLAEEKTVISQTAFQFMIRLEMEDFDVWRRIIVPANINFKKLHFILQDCFNWLSYHLYDFKIFDNSEQGEQIAFISDDDEAIDFEKENSDTYMGITPLSAFLPKYKRVLYSYDYGDGWEHTCELEKVIENYSFNYPTCIDGSGDAPPDDVGGEGGFADFLDAINDKSNPDHTEMKAWGKMQKFTGYDIEKINKKLQHSLKRKR